jgi:hypothetical protein
MDYYLQYMTPGGRVKERFFATAQDRHAFVLASGCKVLMWRDM